MHLAKSIFKSTRKNICVSVELIDNDSEYICDKLCLDK